MSEEKIKEALAFHKSFPQYSETPLAELNHMTACLGLNDFFVKDESYRFGLNAFKILSGSFAMAGYIAERLRKDVSELAYDKLTSDQLRSAFGQTTFFTATNGNRGRGVTWVTNKLGQKSVVLIPEGSAQTRREDTEKGGTTVTIEEVSYDERVRMASKMAEETENGVMVQGTAWDGYEKIPTWIMQGYGMMALGASQQSRRFSSERPSHVFVQAGTGSLAGAVTDYFANAPPENPPIMVVVEAQAADCLYQSVIKGDGEVRFVDSDLQTIMADLACGEPNTTSFDVLKNHISFFVSTPDWVSEEEMRILDAPLKGDPQVVSGESGAVAMSLVATMMQDPDYQELHEILQLNETSNVLMFPAEEDTDPDNYKKILWR